MAKSKNGKRSEKQEEEAQPWRFRFKWKRRTYEIDFESMTFGERAELEEFTGLAWPLVLASAWANSYKVLTYLAYLAVRRSKDDVELDDFRALTDDDVVIVGEGEDDEEPRPTGSEDETSGRSNSSSGSGSSRPTSKSGRRKS